ncbi:hypothetical protein B0J15DRAFT_505606, partial [Fusarium solani]
MEHPMPPVTEREPHPRRTTPSGDKTRNQKACDVCRSRKVRCVYDVGHQRCQGCVFLDVNCTHQRPRRKRGPPNKLAIIPTCLTQS